jgi:hypothetical protein
MTRPLTENTPERQLGQNTYALQRQEFMPVAFFWRTPDVDEPPPDGPTPELQNGFAQVTPPLERFSYRLHSDGSLEFKGHLDVSGAASGTVALTLPAGDDELQEPSYILPSDQFFLTLITDDGGTTFQAAMVLVEGTAGASPGDVTITWPIS